MKRLVLIPLLLAVAGCHPQPKYQSKMQAEQACKDWEEKDYRDMIYRRCREEKVTNQILGVQSPVSDDSEVKVVRHFRY
tara:strand:+ start:396 stop:632 length:237 start_codon:yes stop_codon:yes gene_type:complete